MLEFCRDWGYWMREVSDGCYCVREENGRYRGGWMALDQYDVDWMDDIHDSVEQAYQASLNYFT